MQRLSPTITSRPARPAAGLAPLAVAIAALLPRAIGLGQFVTIDEVNGWMLRSQRFLDALGRADFAATAQSAHPGITTVWLGGLGLLLHAWLAGRGLIDGADFATRLALMQLPVALANAAAVLAGYALLRRLLGPPLALLAALLWALDPFVIGFSRVLHVDGLLGSFATLSMLAAGVYWLRGGRPALLLLAGVCAGLAMLSKSPGAALAPAAAGLAGWAAWRRGRAGWAAAARELLIWGGAAALTAALLWPALWASPARALAQLTIGLTEEGGEPHQSGNYFLGRPVDAPGPAYYAVAMALRLTPWTLVGLGLLGLCWRRVRAEDRPALAALAWFALIFTLELSVFPKKFDRYLEPAFPCLDALAAAGLWALAAGWRRWARAGAAVALAATAALNAAWWHPYGIIAYNQLLGGAPAGARTFHMGWGEGMPQAAAWLGRQPGIDEQLTLGTSVATLRPYLRPGVGAELAPAGGALPSSAGFALVYLRSLQAGLDPPLDRVAATQRPVYTLWLKGVEYLRIYELAPAPPQALAAGFGPAIGLEGYGLRQDGPGALALMLFWATGAPPPDASLFMHLIGPDGQRVAQIDLPAITAGWEAGRHYRTRASLPLPAGLPPGAYKLVVGLYDPQSFQRLPLSAATPAGPALDGPDALLLATVERP
jgi:hypothetical protein